MRVGIKIVSMVLLFAFAACNKSSAPDCFKTTGKQIVLTRTLSPFDTLQLESYLDVTLKTGPEYKVEINGGENMVDKITTNITSRTLVIENKNQCNFVRGYKHHIAVTVTAPRYKFVVTNSIGNISTANDFAQDTFVVRTEAGDVTINGVFNEVRTSSHGNGNVYFKGKTNNLQSYMNGTNYLNAQDGTITNYVFVESISLADAYVKAPDGGVVEYHIWKTGNLYYEGNPLNVVGKREGKGAVIKK
jgi:hypothetical protein